MYVIDFAVMRQTTIIYEQIFGKQLTPEKRDNSSEWVHRLSRSDACSYATQRFFKENYIYIVVEYSLLG